jgi:hypothetical protein
MEPPQSRVVRIATLLETYLKISVRVGLRGALFVGSWFLLYIGFGITADFLGWLNPPYPFLSIDADPFFVIGSAVIGLFIVQSAGSFLLYHFLVGFEDERSQYAVLWGFISLGFAGALLRVTLPTAIRLLLKLF